MASQEHHFIVYLRAQQCGGSDQFRRMFNVSAPAVRQAIKVVSYEAVVAAAAANHQALPAWLKGSPTLVENKESPRSWSGKHALDALEALNKSAGAAPAPSTHPPPVPNASPSAAAYSPQHQPHQAPLNPNDPSNNIRGSVNDMFAAQASDGNSARIGFQNPDAHAVNQSIMDVGCGGAYGGAMVDDDLYCSKICKDTSGSGTSGRGNFSQEMEKYRAGLAEADRRNPRNQQGIRR